MDTITSGAAWTVTLDAGGKASAGFTPPKPGKYVFLPTGSPALVGVYEGTEAVGSRGKLRIEAGARRGVRTLNAVQHLVTVAGQSAGVFNLLVRPWTFWDYFG